MLCMAKTYSANTQLLHCSLYLVIVPRVQWYWSLQLVSWEASGHRHQWLDDSLTTMNLL